MYKTSPAKEVLISLFLFVLFSKPTVAAEKLAPAGSKQGPEIFVQLGHTGKVNSIAFSPDGKYALSGSADTTMKLWEVSTGREIKTFIGHTSGVTTVSFSPDGRYVLLGNEASEKGLKLWEISTGKEIVTFTGYTGLVHSVAFSPDGRHILSGGGSEEVLQLWDISTGKVIRYFEKPTQPGWTYSSVSFSPDGKYALSGNSNGVVRLWEISTGKEIRTFNHTRHVDAVSFSPDGKYVLSGDFDKILKLWDTETGKEIRTFTGHTGAVKSVAFSYDGKYALSGGYDNTLKLWDISTGKEIRTFTGHTDAVNSVAFSPDGKYALSGSWDGTLKLWDIFTGKDVRTFKGYASSISSVAVSPHGGYALSGGANNTFKLWDIQTGKEIRTFKGLTENVTSVAFSSDSGYALSTSWYGPAKLWDIVTGTAIKKFEGNSYITSVSSSFDLKYVLSGGQEVVIWDISTGKEIRRFTGHGKSLGSVAFSPDGKYALSGENYAIFKNNLKLWDVLTGQEIRAFTKDTEYCVYAASFSPNGRYALSGCIDVTLWDISTGREIRIFEGHKSPVNSLSFSPDSKYALSGSSDKSMKLWDIFTGKEVRTFKGHTMPVSSVFFFPDGKYVFSGSNDGTARIWDVNTGKEVAQFISFTDGEWIVITPEGYYNASPNGDKHLNVRIGNNVYGIENYREAFFRPDIVKLALSGGSLKDFNTLADVKQPPVVSIVDTPNEANKDEAAVTLKVVDIGGGIGDVRLYLNGSAVILDSARGVKIVPTNKNEVLKTYNLKLTNGINTIRAIAFNAENTMQSNDTTHTITASFTSLTKPSLNAIIVGINEYKNPKLQLKYAVSDAELFEDTLKKVTAGLFEKVNIKKLVTKEKTTSENIIKELKAYKALNPDDVFVFFVASHGTVDDGEYFLITSNVGSTRTEKLKTDALPQGMLKELIANIPATKKLIIIDTCSAGALGEAIQVAMLTRGMSEDTAMKILSRAVGSTILSASTSVQEAVEGYQGHGLFTYVLVEGLKGKADKGKTGYVKTTELADYVDSEVPVLAEKVFKKAQYPTISISGQAFPIGKTGK